MKRVTRALSELALGTTAIYKIALAVVLTIEVVRASRNRRRAEPFGDARNRFNHRGMDSFKDAR